MNRPDSHIWAFSARILRGRTFGLPKDTSAFNSFAMLSMEVLLVTSAFFSVPVYEAALAALEAGAVAPRLLVTGTITLAETPAVFEALKQRTEQCKVMIAP